jgi:phosphoglycerate dehydrogenase-like enzyme
MSWKTVVASFLASGTVASSQVILMPEGMKKSVEGLTAENPTLKPVYYGKGADAIAHAAEAEGYIGSPDAAFMRAATKLRWVHIFSAGIDSQRDLPRFQDEGLTVTSLKIHQGPEIADHAFALLLGLTRNMASYHAAQGQSEWQKSSREGLPLIELRGKTMLIIGYGGIGAQVGERARAFGMKVLAVDDKDIPLTVTVDRFGKPDELDAMLPEADVVVSCVPHTPESDKMLGAEQFKKMKKGAYFINVSRGKIADTAALVEALQSGHLAAAGLDVVDPEPLPKESPLWKMHNVIITPHIAGVSDQRSIRSNELVLDNIVRFAKGIPLKNQVDAVKGY